MPLEIRSQILEWLRAGYERRDLRILMNLDSYRDLLIELDKISPRGNGFPESFEGVEIVKALDFEENPLVVATVSRSRFD